MRRLLVFQVATGFIEDSQQRRWLVPPEFITTAGQSYTLTRDGRVVYVRGSAERAVQYLRVIPNWVERMKRAVDEANR